MRLAIPLPSSHVLGPQMVAKIGRVLEVLVAVGAVVVLIAIVVLELLIAIK